MKAGLSAPFISAFRSDVLERSASKYVMSSVPDVSCIKWSLLFPLTQEKLRQALEGRRNNLKATPKLIQLHTCVLRLIDHGGFEDSKV